MTFDLNLVYSEFIEPTENKIIPLAHKRKGSLSGFDWRVKLNLSKKVISVKKKDYHDIYISIFRILFYVWYNMYC